MTQLPCQGPIAALGLMLGVGLLASPLAAQSAAPESPSRPSPDRSPGNATVTETDGQSEEPFDYFRNSWNVIGLRDYEHGTRITPDNVLELAEGRQVRLRIGRNLIPLSRRQTKTLYEGWMPIVLLQTTDGAVEYRFRLWATPLPTLKDWGKAFNWPTEGENFLNWIVLRVRNAGREQAEARFQVELDGRTLRHSQWTLPPGGRAEVVVRIPFAPVQGGHGFEEADAGLWFDRTVAYWQGLMAQAARIEVPCRKATEALLAAHVCQLIANDHGQLQGGEGFYDQFFIRDGGYQIMELEEAGLWDAAAKAIDHYRRAQRRDGRFETQRGQLDANGQALWVLWQYYKITGARDWLEETYPQMRRAVDWMTEARRRAPADSPFAGLLPAAPADGEYLWDGKHHIVGYDLWNLRGLLCTADAARALGRHEEAERLEREADEYRAAIDTACRRVGLAHLPPSWEKDGTHWGNTETLWPTPLFSADDPRVVATLHHARHVHGGGFWEGTIRWLGCAGAIHPYLSAYTTMASLRRNNDDQVVEDFYWYLLHSTAAHAFPEGVYPRRRFAWGHTIPHVTGASNFALMLRHMLVDERGDELHLLCAVPDWWLDPGRQIHVQRAPTHFGLITLRVRGKKEGVEVELEPPHRDAPRRIVLYLPQSRPLVNRLQGVQLVTRPPQSRRWDFATVIELYRQQAGPALKPIPHVVRFPLAEPVDPDRSVTVDLTAVANTDPFTAPFGVPNPGKFLFTGLKTGRQILADVPFYIIPPQQNQGRSFVVLHSPKAPANRDWPREVRIQVGQVGKRLFFLGNVHGWSSQDPGTGPWGAVAEYRIVYEDGQVQTVPLITGRTIDEWAARPEADEVAVGARGQPWHLNVLGVKLRDVAVREVLFRDLGTPAAPVLVAVTLE
ncbi:MAG TPA: hypothetical protein EYH34_14715 [Planctomycetes bacterium]|nr:hypothetical protein [Planctomycetota bacterium]